MLREQLRNLNKWGVPYAFVARLVDVDKSHISRFANDEANISDELESKIKWAILAIKQAINYL